ncbi:MAG: hypothetical protein JSS67_08205 [Bacteroidetes bacterium]|nr:hypothetical protein [Bacteroidota bacterium]
MFTDFYHSLYYGTLILSACLSLFLFHKASRAFRFLALLIIITFISEYLAKYLSTARENNSIIYHFFTPVEYFIYTCIYRQFLKGKIWNKFFLISISVVLLMEILNTRYLQPLNIDNTNIMMLENILLVFLSLMLFFQIRTSHLNDSFLKDGVFWFNSIILIYYTFNILISGFHSFKVYQMQDPPLIMYQINLLLSALLYLIYSLAIILNVSYRVKLIPSHE